MRKLVEAPLGELGLIADHASFTGYLEDDYGSLSDASFYEYDGDCTEDELDSILDSHDTQIFKKEALESFPKDNSVSKNTKKFKPASKKVNGGREKEKQLLKKTQKGSKIGIETSDDSEQQSASEQEASREPYSRLSRQQQKLSKKRRDGSANFDDIEVDAKAQRKEKSLEALPKKRGTASVKVESGSGIKSEKLRDAKIKEEHSLGSLDLREADAEDGGTAVQSFQRRKKLCKAVELTSAGERGYKGKGKRNPEEAKEQTGEKSGSKGRDHLFMEGLQRKKSEVYSSDSDAPIAAAHESSLKASPIKSFKQAFPKEQKFTKDEDGLARDELPGEGRSTFLVRKGLPSVKSLKHRNLKHEDVAGSSSTGKRLGFNNNLMPSVVRSRKKAGQAVKDLCASLETVHSVVEHRRHAVEKVCDNGVAGEEVSSGVTEGAEGNKELVPDVKGGGDSNAEPAGTEVGWVMCDSCSQWRCIPASLADIIESTNCGWLCKDNPDKNFADCLVPQEKTNKEINEELDLSEVSFCEEGDEKHPAIDSKLMNGIEHQSKLSGQPQSTWTLIKHNIFQHRRRKTQTIDEQMVCTCGPSDGGAGCGDDCLNRMLSIECVAQTCPRGDSCSNQQFQRRLYTKVSWFRCGKKGFGLQVLEDVSKGAFIIEYVGEVLDMVSYEARQKEYALGGQKHFYFMTLSNSEVIDACVKGNLGRFINHSCEPNCRTEKWMVNGEVCIGLFAIRDLKKGEEITFDYNFVRVCGAAAKKCLCGSRDCRGFIGGDPMTPRSVVHSDSEEDDPEPIMIEESSEEESRIEDSKLVIDKKRDEKAEAIPPLELRNKERNWMLNESSERQGASSEQVKAKPSIKKSNSANGKRLTIVTSGGRFEGVEEKLNELVDESGSLCKGHSHAGEIATEYLKLLAMTAMSPGNVANGEGSRSTRELSMVLDALLKTQSRAILVEVINRNGLQILHKMIHISRKDYKKTPIIRKLLKVLEFLAVKRVLTTEQINSEPTCSGAESVKDTISQLCRHADMEVQQMAYQFREKWLKGSSHKSSRRGQGLSSDLSKWRLFPKQNHPENSGAAPAEDETKKKRKRPSRWDQPSQEVLDTTLAGGLPQSFWPFNANNLILGNSQQSSVADHSLRQTGGASSDELGAMHPGPPSFPVAYNQHHVDTAHIGTNIPGVVSGIPVEQFSAGSSMGYMAQQGSICIGIPITQFQGTRIPGSDCSYMPQMFTSPHQVNHPPDGQAMPVSSNMVDVQEQRQHEFDVEPSDKASEEPNITFGISHSQFFQQMHGIFGSAFHPWQLQSLMAPHAWGPFLSGDARIRDIGFLNESGPACRQPAECRGLDESTGKPVEPNGAAGYTQDTEPPVPGLSPPLPPLPPPPPYPYPTPPVQAPQRTNGRPYMGSDHQARSSVPPQQQLKSSSWKPQRWNSPRWPKFQGNKYRNPGFRRDNNYMQRNNRQTFPRQGPMRSHNDWEDSSSRQHPDRNWGYSNSRGMDHEESMDMDGDGGFNGAYGVCHNESLQDAGNPTGGMPLERPWGYGQEEYTGGNPNNYPGEFSQERGKDTVNSWGVNN
eukprot:c24385_g1_i2 orf=369-5060(+)